LPGPRGTLDALSLSGLLWLIVWQIQSGERKEKATQRQKAKGKRQKAKGKRQKVKGGLPRLDKQLEVLDEVLFHQQVLECQQRLHVVVAPRPCAVVAIIAIVVVLAAASLAGPLAPFWFRWLGLGLGALFKTATDVTTATAACPSTGVSVGTAMCF
jgi:hypothetical protein